MRRGTAGWGRLWFGLLAFAACCTVYVRYVWYVPDSGIQGMILPDTRY